MTPEQIKQLRERMTFTQDEMAKKLGYHDRSTVCNWETGAREPTGPALALLREWWEKYFGKNDQKTKNRVDTRKRAG